LELNFRRALAALARAFPAYLPYAGVLVLAGLLVLLEFAIFLVVLRLALISAPVAAWIVTAAILLAGWLTLAAWRRLFLFRRQAAMLYLFSGADPCRAKAAVGQWFPSHSTWARWNRDLRRALFALRREGALRAAPTAGIGGWLSSPACGGAVLSLAFARGHEAEAAIRAALALFFSCGERTRSAARNWLGFSALGLGLIFLSLAIPNWFFFRAAGAPVAVGVALAAVISWYLHQAFVAPLALAGVSAALLAETSGREPDPALCEKIAPLLTP